MIELVEQGVMVSSDGKGVWADNDVVVVRMCLEDDDDLSVSDVSMSIVMMRRYVRGRMAS